MANAQGWTGGPAPQTRGANPNKSPDVSPPVNDSGTSTVATTRHQEEMERPVGVQPGVSLAAMEARGVGAERLQSLTGSLMTSWWCITWQWGCRRVSRNNLLCDMDPGASHPGGRGQPW